MIKTLILILLLQASLFSQDILNTIGGQLTKKDNIINGRFPVYTVNGKWTFSEKPNWFAGFTAGELWYMYELTGKEEFKTRALKHADNLIQYASLDNTHDLGFIFFNSSVKAYKHTGEKKYRDAAIQAARMLVKRFNANGNFIRAWGKLGTDDREGWMIIDTMMNLELLYWAAQETGDISFYDIAYKHAIKCMNENVRNNFSSYHVIEFDPATGKVIKKKTHQGYQDETTWARGQAWGIYGFALSYKYTGDKRFFAVAQKMTEYFMQNNQQDLIPHWDLDLKGDTVIRDASAAAIAASGMYLLSELVTKKDEHKKYLSDAGRITNSLIQNYLFTKSKRSNEEGLLLHTVYNYAKGWGIDESYPAGDFYFMECLRKQTHYKQEEIKNNGSPRSSFLINNNWFYLEDGINDYNKVYKSAVNWEKINLPHTWNKEDALDVIPGYRRNSGWYEKELFVSKDCSDKRNVLHFEGVNNKAEVYVNGKLAGSHIGGYVGFDIDITPFVVFDSINTITVKADNSNDPYLVPSQKSDFILYGGISRNVWYKLLPHQNISSVLVTTPEVNKKKALTSLKLTIPRPSKIEKGKYDVLLKAAIKDKSGKIVSEEKTEVKFIPDVPLKENNQPAEFLTVIVSMPDVKNPNLWSPSNPYLYTLHLSLIKDNKIIDTLSEKIGYRFYEFKEHGAFYFNGERLLLKGTHRHEELSGYGNALPDSIHRKDMQLIKDMGANFVRLAHYPQAPEVYKACDELGLLVWDENPWCRGGVGPFEWQQNAKNIFREMILQNYNHPSIILWSIGNESDWLPDFEGGDNPDSLKAFAIELHKLAKELDPYRLTTTRKFPAAQNVVDVFSPSIWSGWYSDIYKNYEKTLTKAKDQYTRMFHAEYGGDSHVGRHTETPIDGEGLSVPEGGNEMVNKVKVKNIANEGDWSESYIVDLFDWYLHVHEKLDWFTGSAQWIFRDFTTPLRPENPIPYVNQKGLVDMNNNPKDAYYVFKSYWSESPKFSYIESHTWLDRHTPKDKKSEVNVFSNCSEIELYINDISQGKKKKDITQYPASGLSWNVSFNEGKNNIKAVGYENNTVTAIDTLKINFTSIKNDKPEDLKLTYERMPNGNYLITALAIDKNGRRCLDFNRRVYFTALSGGELLDNLGTPQGSSTIEMANGKAQIIFKHIPLQKGVIEVRNQDFKGTYIIIEESWTE